MVAQINPIPNAAVFFGRSRRNKGVNVFHDTETIVITNRITGDELASYPIVEVAKEGMAWDVTDSDGEIRRLTAQQGCGCSGIKSYSVDQGYSGRIA